MNNIDELLGTLQTLKNNYAIAQAGVALLSLPDARERLEHAFSQVSNNPEAETFNYITYIFDIEGLLKHSTSQFRGAALRNLIKETFEVVSEYATAKQCVPALMRAPWYQFLRIIRNCLSHNTVLEFNKTDRKHLPARWSNLEINERMNSAQIPMKGFLTRHKTIQLVDEIILYVKTEFA